MSGQQIILFYQDENWQQRGEAHNIWLHIYPEKKEYEKIVSPYCDIRSMNIVEVKRKSDIEDLINYLSREGYISCKAAQPKEV